MYKPGQNAQVFEKLQGVHEEIRRNKEVKKFFTHLLHSSPQKGMPKYHLSLRDMVDITTKQSETLGFADNLAVPNTLRELIKGITEVLPENWEQNLEYVLRLNITDQVTRSLLNQLLHTEITEEETVMEYWKRMNALVGKDVSQSKLMVYRDMREKLVQWYIALKKPNYLDRERAKSRKAILEINTVLTEHASSFQTLPPKQQAFWNEVMAFISQNGYWSLKGFGRATKRNQLVVLRNIGYVYDKLITSGSEGKTLRRIS
jgi:hypothetical protein